MAALPAAFLILQTLGVLHDASPQLLESHPVLIRRETFCPEALALPNCKEGKKKNLALSLPLYLRVCTYLLLKYRRRDWFSSLAAPLKKEGQGLNLCRVNTWLDFWKMLSFILLLPACQLDSWVFLCALRSAWSGPSDKAMC